MDVMYKIKPKDSKVKRIAATGAVFNFKKGPIVVSSEALKNVHLKNAVQIVEEIPINKEKPEDKNTAQPGSQPKEKKESKEK